MVNDRFSIDLEGYAFKMSDAVSANFSVLCLLRRRRTIFLFKLLFGHFRLRFNHLLVSLILHAMLGILADVFAKKFQRLLC